MHASLKGRALVPATLAAIATLASATAHAQAAPLPPLSVRTAQYEIYASDSATLGSARNDLEYAIGEFRKLFGTAPGPIAVVYLDGGSIALNTTSFAQRGFRTLPMTNVKTREPSQSGRFFDGASPDGGRVLGHEACHIFLIDYVDRAKSGVRGPSPTGVSYGHPDIPDWFDEAVATLCEGQSTEASRRAQVAQRLNDRIPLARLLAMDHPLAAARAAKQAPAMMVDGPNGPTPVDLDHMKFFSSNGADAAPDSATLAKIRRVLAGDTTAGSVRFTTSGLGDNLPPGTEVREFAQATTTRQTARDQDPALSATALMFYGEAQSLARFVIERSGAQAVGRLADALIAGRSSADALAALPNLPHDLPALEAAWSEWLTKAAR